MVMPLSSSSSRVPGISPLTEPLPADRKDTSPQQRDKGLSTRRFARCLLASAAFSEQQRFLLLFLSHVPQRLEKKFVNIHLHFSNFLKNFFHKITEIRDPPQIFTSIFVDFLGSLTNCISLSLRNIQFKKLKVT